MIKINKARPNALEIILGLSENESIHKDLHKAELCKILMKLLESSPNDRDLVLQNIINLSGYDIFQDNLHELNAIYRISFMLFETVKKELEETEKEKDKDLDLDLSLDLLTITTKTKVSSNIVVKTSKL